MTFFTTRNQQQPQQQNTWGQNRNQAQTTLFVVRNTNNRSDTHNSNSNSNSNSNHNHMNGMSNLNQFLTAINIAIKNQNGKLFSQLLAFRRISPANKLQILRNSDITVRRICGQCLTSVWILLMINYIKAERNLILSKNLLLAWDSSNKCCTTMHNQIIRPTTNSNINSNDNNKKNKSPELCANNVWYLPVINVVLKQFTDIAIAYHQYLMSNSNSSENDIIVTAFNQVMQIIRDMTADHTNRTANNSNGLTAMKNNGRHTLSHGLFFTVNKIIKLCDVVNNQTYLNHALMEVNKFRAIFNSFPLSDVVTHLYYAGRFNISRDELLLAQTDLLLGFKLCQNETLNKIRFLLLLIPIQIMNGYLPRQQALLEKYQLMDEFFPLMHAIKTGNILLFRKHLLFYENAFINCGIYLLIERLEHLVFRSLLQKIYVVRRQMHAKHAANGTLTSLAFKKTHIINLTDIITAIRIQNAIYAQSIYCRKYEQSSQSSQSNQVNEAFDILLNEDLRHISIDEIECVLANLICKKLIKGYVAHNQAIVLKTGSVRDAFPPIKTAKSWWKNVF